MILAGLNSNQSTFNDVVLTLDTDWAPDFVIDYVADQLIECQVRATWFVTHSSPAIERLRMRPELFELGIHPNFLNGSTQGEDPDAVMEHCLDLVPDATSMRTHSLYQSTPLLSRIALLTPITTDVSLFLPSVPRLQPFEYEFSGRRLLRIPYFWEDDFEMERSTRCWNLGQLLDVGTGLKVFNFHPIHVYMNSSEMGPYKALATKVGRISEATLLDATDFVQQGVGTQRLFMELVRYLDDAGSSLHIRDLAARWRVSNSESPER